MSSLFAVDTLSQRTTNSLSYLLKAQWGRAGLANRVAVCQLAFSPGVQRVGENPKKRKFQFVLLSWHVIY